MIKWDKGLELGAAKLDNEHKQMLEYINKLYEDIQQDNSKEKKEQLYNAFLSLLNKHLESESQVVKNCQFSISKKDQHYYDHFRNELYRVKEEYINASSKDEVQKICLSLTGLVLNHIIEADIPLIKDLQQCGVINNTSETKLSFVDKLIQKITNSFSFTKRIFLSALIPMLAMFFFISVLITHKYEDYQKLSKTSNIIYLLPDINKLIHAMQIERGLSCAYLFSKKSDIFEQRLVEQKKVVHDDIVLFKKKLQKINLDKIAPIDQNIQIFQNNIISLQQFRQKVSKKEVSFEETIKFYTDIINNIINITPKMTLLNLDRKIASSISSLASLLRYKETLGLKRARGTILIEIKKPLYENYIAFIELNGVEKMMMEYFKQNATDANKKKFEALLSSKIVQEIHFYETSIINKDFSKLDPVEWFQKMTAFINDIKLLEDKLLEEISYAVGVNLHKEKRDLILMIITTLMTFMVILFIIYLLQQSSKREILKYTNAIHHLAQGDRSIKLIDVMAKDEMAQMYDAYEKTRQSLLKGDVYTKLYLREKENEIKRKEEETQILQEIAYKDPLTGALNRRKFEEIVRVEFKRAKRYSIKLSFLMMDIDHFKSINDTYGHAVGDEVLKYFVSTYLSMARELDILARIGGEEFVVVLPETDSEGAFAVAERFRKRIEKSCVIVDDKKICFTVSIGIATFDVTKKDQTPETLLEEADKALYEAKKTGRNKTIIAK